MRIVVCVKHVPDAESERSLDDRGRTVRGEDDVLGELDENAVEAAVSLVETHGGEVVALTMGPEGASDALRRALQMGADRGVHVCDETLAGADVVATARVLAAAVRAIAADGPVDLVITAMATTDGGTAMLPTALATALDLPQLTLASELVVDDGEARIRRDVVAAELLAAPLPALVSVTDQANEPRYPNFRAIMAARKKPVTTWSLAELGDPDPGVATTVLAAAPRPPREPGRIVTDDGDGGAALAAYLVESQLVGSASADSRPADSQPAAPTPTGARPAAAGPAAVPESATGGTVAVEAAGSESLAAPLGSAPVGGAPVDSVPVGTMAQASVLVVVDQVDGVLGQSAAELLAAARAVADGAPVAAVWLAADGPADDARARLAALGAATVYVPRLDGLEPQLTAVAVDAVHAVATATEPQTVLVSSSLAGKELAAGLAVRLGSGAVVDARGLSRREDGTLVASKTVFAATWDTECAVLGRPAIVALEPGAVELEAGLPGEIEPGTGQASASQSGTLAADAAATEPVRGTSPAEIVPVTVDAGRRARAVRVVERTRHPRTGQVPLSEASVVVVGGRGTEGDFSLVDELAELLGGAVGATRDVTDEGWREHSAQIGQTGATVAPRLYIGAGVSGAVHHTVGMRAAQTVVAINTDPDAPIFEIADFGVVGALEDVLPQAIEALREHLGQPA